MGEVDLFPLYLSLKVAGLATVLSFIVGTALAFTRALGEFGATLMVAGNIPGLTQTMPIAIYDAVQSGNTALANILVGLVTVFALVTLLLLERVGKVTRW